MTRASQLVPQKRTGAATGRWPVGSRRARFCYMLVSGGKEFGKRNVTSRCSPGGSGCGLRPPDTLTNSSSDNSWSSVLDLVMRFLHLLGLETEFGEWVIRRDHEPIRSSGRRRLGQSKSQLATTGRGFHA